MEENLQKRVGFGPRLGAYLIDGVFISIIVFLMSLVFGAAGAGAGAAAVEGGDPDAQVVAGAFGAIAGMIVGLVIGTFGYVLIEAITGASLGKMILGLKAGTLDGKKGSVGLYMGRACLKYCYNFPYLIAAIIPATFGAMYLIAFILSIVVFIGCFFALRESKQSLHDQIAKTAIYYKKDLS